MEAPEMDPLEAMLRLCARCAPKPWYPRLDADKLGAPPDEVYQWLELLFLSGLVEKAPGSAETGPGVVLTPLGAEVLDDEERLQRLREGRALGPDDRGGAVREMIRRPRAPLVSRLLLFAVLGWFGYSVYLASQAQVVQRFLAVNPFGGGVDPAVVRVLEKSGALTGVALVHHEWTRLLSAPFVHFGLFHLLLDVLVLVGAGGRAEQMWGRERFLVIFVLTALGGCAIGVAMEPRGVQAGITGALCGLLGAEAVWLVLNGRYLPKQLRASWRFGLVLNIAFLAALCFLPGGGLWGLAGALLVGAVLGLLLNYQRFGPEPFRWLAVPVVALLPVAGWQFLEHRRRDDPKWHDAERMEFARYYETRYKEGRSGAEKVYKNQISDVLAVPAKQRNAEKARKAYDVAATQRRNLQTLEAALSRSGPYYDRQVREDREKAIKATSELAEKFAAAEKDLQEGLGHEEKEKKRQKGREEEFEKEYLPRLAKVVKKGDAVLTDKLRALTATPADHRDKQEVAAILPRLAEVGKETAELGDVFLRLRTYKNKVVEEARDTGKDYLLAAAEYCRLAERCLRGDGWKPEDDAALKEKAAEVEKLRAKLRDIF